MKGTINKVTILGRLGQDPEVRYTTNGNAIANVNIATTGGYKDKQTGQYVYITEWHRVVVYNKMAEVVQQYCKKGSQLCVEGRIRTNKWTDETGQDRYTTEIIANEVQLIGGKPQNAYNPPVESYEQNQIPKPSDKPINGQQQVNQYAQMKGNKPSQSEAQKLPTAEEMAAAMNDFQDDEIPF